MQSATLRLWWRSPGPHSMFSSVVLLAVVAFHGGNFKKMIKNVNLYEIFKCQCCYLKRWHQNSTQGYFYINLCWWWLSELIVNPRTPLKVEGSAHGTRLGWLAVVRGEALLPEGKPIIFIATLNGVRGIAHSWQWTSGRVHHGFHRKCVHIIDVATQHQSLI